MKALILAGGRGKRFEEITEYKSKSLIDVWGKKLIEYNLDEAAELGVDEIIITVCYKKKEIMKSVGKKYKGIKVTYVDEGFKENSPSSGEGDLK